MHLREIEMENFKSFGRKVKIPFLEGYTAITGPNGCGKSNISDAVLFVLGPKSSKAIRAGRLTDLIWDGGKEGKAASHTQVSLSFDNRDRVIPIEADEVRLTRRVLRSPTVEGGYNSYFYVNGRKSQLQEFDQLLAHARISAEGYNLVQQGDVQRIVQMSTVDRRRVLDDIAGITKFDQDIATAEGKRKSAEDNLERIRIILQEIEKQLKLLDSDRDGALKYRETKGKVDLAKAQMVHKRRALVEEAIASAKQQLAKYDEERGRLEGQKRKLQEQLAAAGRNLHDVEAKIAERGGDEARQIQTKLDDVRVDRATTQNDVEKAKEAIKRLKVEGRAVSRDRTKQRKEIEALEEERDAAVKRLSDVGEQLKAVEADLKATDEVAAKSDAKVIAIQRDVVALSNKVDALEGKVHTLTLEGDRGADAVDRLTAELEELEKTRATYTLELEDTEFQIKEARGSAKGSKKSVRKLREEFRAKQGEEAELSQQMTELEQAVLARTREYERVKAESEVADAVRRGYTRAVAALLEARDKYVLRGIHGTVAELVRVEGRYETAMNIAAGNRMQAVVVDTDDVAAKLIEYLKKTSAGRATFLPLNKMVATRPRGKAVLAAKETLGFAIDLIDFDEKYRNALSYVLGDTLVVETLDEARRLMGGVRMVTLDGELIEASGAIIGGKLDKPVVGFGRSRGELETVAAELRKAKEQADRARGQLERLRSDLATLESELREVDTSTGSVQVKLDTLKAKRKEFAAKVSAVEGELRSKTARLTELRKASEMTAGELGRLSKQLDALRKRRERKKGEVIEATPQQVAVRMKELSATKSQLQEEFHAVTSKVETFDTQRKVLGERLADLDGQLAANGRAVEESERRIAQGADHLVTFEKEIRGLEKMAKGMGREVKELQARRDEAFREKTNLEAAIDKVAQKMEAKESMVVSLQTALREQEGNLRQAEEELSALSVEVTGDLPSLETLKRTIADAEARLDALGNVNLRALEDYEGQQKRHDELSEEFQQLKVQRSDLIKLVKELNGKRKSGLLKVFRAINDNFVAVYAELSEGGEAKLLLENPEDVLQGGLIIKAKPPHGKAKRLEALSGGEKSLVSMAFLFAIQQYDPSPFYLLDEVDQNLDAVNAEKVARMIRRNSHVAQFAQISLRKVTLKEADHLLGVTLRPDGNSEVVMKVNLADISEEQMAAEVTA